MLLRSRLVWVGSVFSLVMGASNACSGGTRVYEAPTGGSSGDTGDGGAGASKSGTGGKSSGATGGSEGSGGAAGETSSGGANSSAGSDAGGAESGAGGDSTNGGEGNTTGGTKATGGAATTGGAGGTATTGGAGGTSAAGGAGTTGGANTTGGAKATGGAATTGGAGTTGGASTTGGAGGGASCGISQEFQPDAATVYVMVDRSGSMFDCLSTSTSEPACADASDTAWTKLKAAALSVIQERQAQVRFGFAAFTGTNASLGGTCPMIDKLTPQLNNFAAIKTLYDGLPFQPNTTVSGQKFETPARQSLDLLGAALLADPAPGKKYILFVTDGQPDYCDDGSSLCPPDSVVAGLQDLYAKGITTLVMGIQSAQFDLPQSTLQSFANAGSGESTKAPLRGTDTDVNAFYDQCSSTAGWQADLVKSGKAAVRGVTLGTYSATSGPTTPYTPSVSDSAALVAALGAAVSNAKTCSIDLSQVYGKPTQVDTSKLSSVQVLVNGTAIAYDASSGWSLPSAGLVSLNGAACTAFRSAAGKVALNFPCDSLIQ